MPTEPADTSMLDLWAEHCGARMLIEDFIMWLPPRFHSGHEAALDAFFGIDRVQLERERREFLAGLHQRDAATSIDPDGGRP